MSIPNRIALWSAKIEGDDDIDLSFQEDVFRYKYSELVAGGRNVPHANRYLVGNVFVSSDFLATESVPAIDDLLKEWTSAEYGRFKGSSEAYLADWVAKQDCRVIRASGVNTSPAEDRRLTHDTVRRVANGVLVVILITQFIFLVTDVTILHPAAAVLIGLIALSFLRMATLMRRELHHRLENSR